MSIISMKGFIIRSSTKLCNVNNIIIVNLDSTVIFYIEKILFIFNMENSFDLISEPSKHKSVSEKVIILFIKSLIKEKHVYIITMIRTNEEQLIFNIAILFVQKKSALLKYVPILTTNQNSFITQIDIKQNFVSFIPNKWINVIIEIFVHLLTLNMKQLKILN